MTANKPPNMPMSVSLDRLTEFDTKLIELRNAGVPFKQIASILQRHERRITSRYSALKRLPKTIDEAEARKLEDAKKRACGNVPKSIDDLSSDDRLIIQLYVEGRSITLIAADLGLHRRTVSDRLVRFRKALGESVVPYPGDIEDRIVAKQAAAPRNQPATIPCMCCRRQFKSWDRMRNRICGHCKSSHAQIHDTPEERLCL